MDLVSISDELPRGGAHELLLVEKSALGIVCWVPIGGARSEFTIVVQALITSNFIVYGCKNIQDHKDAAFFTRLAGAIDY